jgi:nucleoid-associated protein YgaU
MWPFGKSTTERINEEMKKYDFLTGLPITFTERGGTVHWNGMVPNEKVKNFLTVLSTGVNGVKDVDTSNIEVMQEATPEVPAVEEAAVQDAIDRNSLAKAVFGAFKGNGELRDDPIEVLQSGDGVVIRGAVDSQHEYNLAVQLANGAGANSVDSTDLKIVENAKAKHADEVQKAAAAKPAYVNQPDEWHIVRPGESLSAIAQKYYGDMEKYVEIAKANNISNPDLIRVGQKIQIPR